MGGQYPLSVSGLNAGLTVGVSGSELIGTATGMHYARDIEGVYSKAGAGVSVAGGGAFAQLSNARGVVLRLRGRQVGFMFSIDLSGMQITLK